MKEKTGFTAVSHGSTPVSVNAEERAIGLANRHGIPFMVGGHPNAQCVELADADANTDAVVVAGLPRQKIVVTRASFLVDNGCSVDVGFRLGFGATTTPTTTGVVVSHPGVAAGSGVVEGNGGGILGVGEDGQSLFITSEVPTGGSSRVVVTYYLIES